MQARPRNSLFALTGRRRPSRGIYDKWHLVPFGEYIPDWLPLPIMVVPGGGFASGPGPRTLHVPGLPPVGALICYEAIFSGQIVDRNDRPAWLVNVTNDAWFGNSTGPRQHLAAARMRAVEEGLPLMRAANTGISAAFDARGHELGAVGYADRPARWSWRCLPALPATLFARFGLWLPCDHRVRLHSGRAYGKTDCSAGLMPSCLVGSFTRDVARILYTDSVDFNAAVDN